MTRIIAHQCTAMLEDSDNNSFKIFINKKYNKIYNNKKVALNLKLFMQPYSHTMKICVWDLCSLVMNDVLAIGGHDDITHNLSGDEKHRLGGEVVNRLEEIYYIIIYLYCYCIW